MANEKKTGKAGYEVIRYADGCGAEYAGHADNLREARDLVARAEQGEVVTTTDALWWTAEVSGNPRPGCDYPGPHDEEAMEWGGADGTWGIFPSVTKEEA